MEERKMLALVDNIISIKPLFFKTLGKPIPMNSNITPGAYYAMLNLFNCESLSMSELGKMLMISKPNVTAIINKLIVKGLVLRASAKPDRRIIMIRLSAKGYKFVETNNKKYLDQVTKKIMFLKDDELELFSVSLQNVKDILLKMPTLR
ncbi:MAG: MarR family transcriptional regulator [Bacteroidota bacterium]